EARRSPCPALLGGGRDGRPRSPHLESRLPGPRPQRPRADRRHPALGQRSHPPPPLRPPRRALSHPSRHATIRKRRRPLRRLLDGEECERLTVHSEEFHLKGWMWRWVRGATKGHAARPGLP